MLPMPLILPNAEACGWKSGVRKGRVRGSADPLKFEAEIKNCVRRLCRTTVKLMAMTTCLTLMHYYISFYMIKLDFWPWSPAEKWFPRQLEIMSTQSQHFSCIFCVQLHPKALFSLPQFTHWEFFTHKFWEGTFSARVSRVVPPVAVPFQQWCKNRYKGARGLIFVCTWRPWTLFRIYSSVII